MRLPCILLCQAMECLSTERILKVESLTNCQGQGSCRIHSKHSLDTWHSLSNQALLVPSPTKLLKIAVPCAAMQRQRGGSKQTSAAGQGSLFHLRADEGRDCMKKKGTAEHTLTSATTRGVQFNFLNRTQQPTGVHRLLAGCIWSPAGKTLLDHSPFQVSQHDRRLLIKIFPSPRLRGG